MNFSIFFRRYAVALALGLLLLLSRPYPLSGIIHLADATNAVFFLGGFLGLSFTVFSVFVALAVAVDFLSIAAGTDPFCISPAYFFLLPTFAILWFAGRTISGPRNARPNVADSSTMLRLTATLLVFSLAQCAAFFISSGSFYFLSGKFADPTLATMLDRTQWYLSGYFMSSFWYVLLCVVALAAGDQWQRIREHSA